MILSETEYDVLRNNIELSKNIYDVLVSMYAVINDENFPSYEANYANEVEKTDDLFENINLKIEEVVCCDIGFSKFKDSILNIFTKENARLNAFYMLLKFDHILEEKEEYPLFKMKQELSLNVLVKVGALNENSDQYRFYLMSKKSLTKMSVAEKESGIRYINRTSGYSIFYRIKSYRILSADTPEIAINLYKNDYFINKFATNECVLKIAVVPVANKPWYDIHYIKNSKTDFNYFEISDKTEIKNEINDSYIKILQELNEKKIEIVIFPELAMNAETENAIRNYLIESILRSPQTHSLKLVFCGSLWKDQENRCTLLSGSGSVLLRNSKRNPFEIKNEGITYKERLKKISSSYNMIDIYGLGRIWYLICKDGLDDIPQMHMQNEYGISFEMISCYSASLSYFEKEAENFSESYEGITVLANCCGPRIKKKGKNEENDINVGDSVGFICMPAMRTTSPFVTTSKVEFYRINKECSRCSQYCSCSQIFTIYPNELQKEEEKIGMRIECKNC